MARQLDLTDVRHVDWRLDDRTREVGRQGLAEARRGLAEARRRLQAARPAA
jgi:hypothetical protein